METDAERCRSCREKLGQGRHCCIRKTSPRTFSPRLTRQSDNQNGFDVWRAFSL